MTVSVYAPFGFELSTFAANHTVVTSLVAVVAVDLMLYGVAEIPAHFVALLVALLSIE